MTNTKEKNTNDLKKSMIAQIGRKLRKARRSLAISKKNTGDADKLLGDDEKGSIKMVHRLKNMSDGQEQKSYGTLAYHMKEAKKALAEQDSSMAKIDLNNAIVKISDIEELIKKG